MARELMKSERVRKCEFAEETSTVRCRFWENEGESSEMKMENRNRIKKN